MIVVFRVDASLQIGTGHVMRCLTLADALSSIGVKCHFICREHPGNLISQIKEQRYQVHVLPMETNDTYKQIKKANNEMNILANSDWLGSKWQKDAKLTYSILENIRPNWLVVDNYALDARWESIQRQNIGKLMVIDDLADRQHDCDLLLDQTLGRSEELYKSWVPQHCKCLTGTKYALLRPEFSALREYSLRRRKHPKLKHILITMGGVDQFNVTGNVLEALKHSQLPNNCHISVVMGSCSLWIDAVKTIAAELPWEIEVLVNVNNMAQLMAESDLCIGAAGSTAWERCCLGLPSLIVVLADNQKNIANMLVKADACLGLGEITESHFQKRVITTINQILKDTKLLRSMTESASSVTDGTGVKITLDILLH